MKNKIILSLIMFFLSFSLMAQDALGVKFEQKLLQDVINMAKAQKKLVFVDCYTGWCAPCLRMSKEVFPEKSLGDYINAIFVSTKIDMEKGEGVTLNKKWDINSYPTFVVLDADGSVRFRIMGYLGVQAMIDTLKAKLQDSQASALEQRYKAGERTSELVSKYIQELQKDNMRKTSISIAEEFCNHQPELLLSESNAFDIFSKYIVNPYNASFVYVYQHRAEFISKYGGNISQMLEDKWRMHAKSYYIMGATASDFKGYDTLKMDEYEEFMKQNGVEKASEYTMRYKLPASILMKDKELLFKNLEASAQMTGISQSQFEFACLTLEKIMSEEKDKERLERIKNLQKNSINKITK